MSGGCHHHHHHHHHGHGHGLSHTQVNGDYWSSAASTIFETEWVISCQKQIREHLQENLPWFDAHPPTDGQLKGKMMDYACGEGYISRFFTSYFSKCIGVDEASGMVDKFNQTARQEKLPETQIYAVKGNLTEAEGTPSIAGEEFFNFDLIIIVHALHHIDDPQKLINRFTERLRPGGIVVVADWEKSGKVVHPADINHPAAHTVSHSGFTEKEMHEFFKNAGCKESDYTVLKEEMAVPEAWGGKKTLFFAKGRK
ncbi:hypothetical protein H109_02988 [Trichophyton interdigitale MR816]|uniref:Methyltransferase domain-containing protein n=1 Tax=Trichophyton interdigitale (strain MR816) TaxID=1215338 RepID=A0A059JCL0_TRIIM|nr:hypothetical protein H101_02977 [Trichophyton interdigitale H6]KDB25172.1 hypothetical protein H109_02988 [Trichophyton interdigitale MR816]